VDNVGVASDEEARAARARRDALWRDHRTDLTAESADRFAPAMKRVDDIDAARLAHAADLGKLRKLEQDMAAAKARATKTREQRDRLTQQAQELEAQAKDHSTSIGLPTLSPFALADWAAHNVRAKNANRRRDMLAVQHQETLDRAERLRQNLLPLVELETPTFDAALSAARRLADAERIYLDEVQAASDKITDLEEDLDYRQDEQRAFTNTAEQTSMRWIARVQELFGDALPPDKLADDLGLLHDLREHDGKRRDLKRRVSAMQDDQQRFTVAVAALGARFDIKDCDPLEMFRHLRDVAEQAQADKSRHGELGTTLNKDRERRDVCNATLEDIDRKVADLGRQFPESVDTSTLDALRTAVGTARDVIEKRDRIAELKRSIFAELSLSSLKEARALIGEQTAPDLDAKIQTLGAELDPAQNRLTKAIEARTNAERDLRAVTGGAEVAELVEHRTTLELQIEEAILEYLQWDVGLRIAETAIRRYRDKHRHAMMASTEQAFAELTNGAYKKLQTQPDGSSEILLAVDANGTPKQIRDMSKGTRFQLYLSLRAAAYEQLVAQGVQLPFFCDDVFETFDDNRTRTACRLMERVGRNGQAIYLTHHRHVVEIAKEVCHIQPVIHEI